MKKITLIGLLLSITIVFSFNIAYIPEIDTSSIGYDEVSCLNLLGDSSLFNPASLSFADKYQISFSYYDYLGLGLLNLQQLYVKQPLKNGFAGLFALQRTYSDDTDTKFDNWIYDYRFSSATKNVSVGMAIKYVTENSFYYEDETNSNVSYLSGDLGIITLLNGFSVGGLAKNIITYKFSSYAIDISPEYIFGIGYGNKVFTLEIDGGKNFNELPIWGGASSALKIGNLTLKGGGRAETDFKSYYIKDISFGASFKISNLMINYAYKYSFLTNSNFLKSNFLTFSFIW
jgi:hypothetical protein